MQYAPPPPAPSRPAPLVGVVSPTPDTVGATLARIRAWVRDALDEGVRTDLPTAGGVDLERFAGTWFVLARLPMDFQDDATVATSEYTRPYDGVVRVTHTAWLGDRLESSISGSVRPVPGSDNDRLRVTYDGLLGLRAVPAEGNLWVLDTADNYSMALVGTPDREALWLLSHDMHGWKTPQARQMIDRAAKLGFDTDRLLVADWDTHRSHS